MIAKKYILYTAILTLPRSRSLLCKLSNNKMISKIADIPLVVVEGETETKYAKVVLFKFDFNQRSEGMEFNRKHLVSHSNEFLCSIAM